MERQMEPAKSTSSGSMEGPTRIGQSGSTSDVLDSAKHTAAQVVEQVKEQASTRLSTQLDQASEGLSKTSEQDL
jgi:hypothetical protein